MMGYPFTPRHLRKDDSYRPKEEKVVKKTKEEKTVKKTKKNVVVEDEQGEQ